MDCCTKHTPDAIDDVKNRECRARGCCNQPFFRVAGTGMVEYCTQHASDGIVLIEFNGVSTIRKTHS